MRTDIGNWGNYPIENCEIEEFNSIDDLIKKVKRADTVIARGLGRSYGDASLGKHILSTLKFNKILNFDTSSGIMHCESGVSIEQILEFGTAKGWFPSVTPGTKFVTVGGAIGADVHGKNHHSEGTFCDSVLEFELLLENGELITCSRTENSEHFLATSGGMGLTGIITTAKIQLKKIESVYIKQEIIPCQNLDEMLEQFDRSSRFTYSVAWIDCFASGKELGKGVLYRGEHALIQDLENNLDEPLYLKDKKKLGVPFNFPSFTLNKLSIKAFNALYYWMQTRKPSPQIVDYDGFFYPLDNINNWNRIYGKNGFVQYQMVLPKNGVEGLQEILELINKNSYGSFLAVLKLFGKKGDGLMSFPEEGYTLALDFPVNKKVFDLLEKLDQIVKKHHGKIYLAKDARMSKASFEEMYPTRNEFDKIRSSINSTNKFSSSQSQRLAGVEAQKHTNNLKNALLLGANSDVAKSLARLFAQDGYNLCLASRNMEPLESLKTDLESTYKIKVQTKKFDALDYANHQTFYDGLEEKPSVAVLSFGVLGDQFEEQKDFALAQKTIDTNFTGAASILEIIAADMEVKQSGSIIGIGSVAGDRGRKKNYFYGAAKAAFAEYLSGLRQRLQSNNVHVMTVKPGFIYSKMTEGMDMPPKLTSSADKVASDIYTALQKKKNVVYTKAIWRLIMFIIKNVPEFIFKKLNF